MFSYFKNGIKNTKNSEIISIDELVEIINTPNILINQIRNLDINKLSEEKYKEEKKYLKSKLNYITPNGIFNYRDKNGLIRYSNYLYFDIDLDPYKNNNYTKEYVINYKNKIIEEYKNYISFCCISPSDYGISFLIKIKNKINNNEEFNYYREYLCNNQLKNIKHLLDSNVKDISRPYYISYDPNCYFNYNINLELDNYLYDNINETAALINKVKKSKNIKL